VDKVTKETARNNYKLGYEFHPVAWYDMLAIWYRVVPIEELKVLTELIGGKPE
jgi:hypothetical protein